MPALKQIDVALADRSYSIEIGQGIFSRLAPRIRDRFEASHVLVVSDVSVNRWSQQAIQDLQAVGIRADRLEVPSGETSKSVEHLNLLWQEFQATGADRTTVVMAIGGGVAGDLAGFAAATYARGLRFIQVPTTLLAMVDSSVGGKTGINLPTSKNMVGAFWQPIGVMIELETLETLPRREYLSGLAEVTKYGVIMDEDFFAFLESNTCAVLERHPDVLIPLVARCCELKAEVVAADERETSGRRAILNYGHTFAHAFENLLGYGTILHGEAVSIGMHCAARLATRLGRVSTEFVERQKQLLLALGLPVETPKLDSKAVLATMQRDKKVAHGKLRFILPDRLGKVSLVDDVESEALIETLEQET
ncbi:MAG: 3-dehydroquinate synthase [Planctomycetota bacterium]|nr:3-dehydroquinate synthase [Planctomycetota bacterium]